MQLDYNFTVECFFKLLQVLLVELLLLALLLDRDDRGLQHVQQMVLFDLGDVVYR